MKDAICNQVFEQMAIAPNSSADHNAGFLLGCGTRRRHSDSVQLFRTARPQARSTAIRECLPSEAWQQLDEAVRRAHEPGTGMHGPFRVEHGRGKVARLLARLARLPPPSESVEACLRIAADGDREHWQRSFGGHSFHTMQWCEPGGFIVERRNSIRLRVAGGALRYEQAGAAFCLGPIRLPLPHWLAPHVEAIEEPAGAGRVRVRVSVTLPFVGLLIAYEGEVTP